MYQWLTQRGGKPLSFFQAPECCVMWALPLAFRAIRGCKSKVEASPPLGSHCLEWLWRGAATCCAPSTKDTDLSPFNIDVSIFRDGANCDFCGGDLFIFLMRWAECISLQVGAMDFSNVWTINTDKHHPLILFIKC